MDSADWIFLKDWACQPGVRSHHCRVVDSSTSQRSHNFVYAIPGSIGSGNEMEQIDEGRAGFH